MVFTVILLEIGICSLFNKVILLLLIVQWCCHFEWKNQSHARFGAYCQVEYEYLSPFDYQVDIELPVLLSQSIKEIFLSHLSQKSIYLQCLGFYPFQECIQASFLDLLLFFAISILRVFSVRRSIAFAVFLEIVVLPMGANLLSYFSVGLLVGNCDRPIFIPVLLLFSLHHLPLFSF